MSRRFDNCEIANPITLAQPPFDRVAAPADTDRQQTIRHVVWQQLAGRTALHRWRIMQAAPER
jgi:hypothetical protein